MSGLETNDEEILVTQLNVNTDNQYVVFSIENEEYGVPILAVQEIIELPEITKLPGTPEHIPGVINLRDKVIPVYDLARRLGIEEKNKVTKVVIILQLSTSVTVGIIVDTVSDVISFNKDELSITPDLDSSVDISFVKKIGLVKNRMIIILDIMKLFSQGENQYISSLITDKK